MSSPSFSLMAAFALSAGLHLGWLAATDPERPRPPRRPTPSAMTWVAVIEAPAPTRREPESPPTVPAPARPRAPRRIQTQPVPFEPAAERPTAAGSAPAGRPLADESTSGGLLLPRTFFGEAGDAGPAVTEVRDSAKQAEAMVRALSTETIGRGRVERGLVHPYYVELGKTLVKQWDADRVVAQGSLSTWAEQVGKNARIFNELWLDTASQYGKTGAPVLGDGRGDGRRPAPLDGIGGLPGIDLQARKEVQRQLRKQFEATRRATIRVVQDRSGKLTEVELVDPSTDAAVDRQALADVRAAAEKLPPPPAEALGEGQRLSSLWSFELVISISPPVPTFTFEFDEVVGTIDPRLPLDRRVYKKVRLVAVE